MKADTAGVFVPSVDDSSVENCLDTQFSTDVSELAASISHYPQQILSITVFTSNIGLSSLCQLFSLPRPPRGLCYCLGLSVCLSVSLPASRITQKVVVKFL